MAYGFGTTLRRSTTFLYAIVLCLGLTACATTPNAGPVGAPTEFRSEEGRFSIMMPGTPAETRQSVFTPAGPVEMIMYTVEDGDGARMVGYADYDARLLKGVDIEKVLDGARNGALTSTNARLVSERRILMGRWHGREYVADANVMGMQARLKSRFFLVNNRLYQILAVGKAESMQSADITDFLASFRLIPAKQR